MDQLKYNLIFDALHSTFTEGVRIIQVDGKDCAAPNDLGKFVERLKSSLNLHIDMLNDLTWRDVVFDKSTLVPLDTESKIHRWFNAISETLDILDEEDVRIRLYLYTGKLNGNYI